VKKISASVKNENAKDKRKIDIHSILGNPLRQSSTSAQRYITSAKQKYKSETSPKNSKEVTNDIEIQNKVKRP